MKCDASTGAYGNHQCTRKAAWTVNGNPRCTQHMESWKRQAETITRQPLTIERASA